MLICNDFGFIMNILFHFTFEGAMPAVVCSTSCLSLSCWQLGQHHIKLHHPLVFISKNTTISNLLFYLVLKYYSFFQMQSHLVLSVFYSQLSISSMFHNSHIISMFFLYSQMFCKKQHNWPCNLKTLSLPKKNFRTLSPSLHDQNSTYNL